MSGDENAQSPRTEFGAARSTCDCRKCIRKCRFIPGYLIPADLDRLIPPGADPLAWAQEHLAASPGAIVRGSNGQVYRIPTLVPATRPGGSTACHWLGPDDRCNVHANAPFGCAMFDCETDEHTGQLLSNLGLTEVSRAFHVPPGSPRGLYARIWHHLDGLGICSPSPEAKRAAMAAFEKPTFDRGTGQ